MDGINGMQDAMHVELQVAMNFIISYLYNKLPRTRVHLFGEELEKLLRIKFIGHWYPANPVKGSAFRCVHLNSTEIDPSFEIAAVRSGLDFVSDIKSNLPSQLSVWVDPGEVSYAIGGVDGKLGPVKVLFKDQSSSCQGRNHDDSSVHQAIDITRDYIQLYGSNTTFNPHAKGFLPNSVDVESADVAVHADQAPKFCYSLRPQRKLFTVNEFASTKFGSTKVKCDSRNTSDFPGIPQAGFKPVPMHSDILMSQSHYFIQLSRTLSPDPIEDPSYIQVLAPSNQSSSSSNMLQSSTDSSATSSPDHSNRQANTAVQDQTFTFRWSQLTSNDTFESSSTCTQERCKHSLFTKDIGVTNLHAEDMLQ